MSREPAPTRAITSYQVRWRPTSPKLASGLLIYFFIQFSLKNESAFIYLSTQRKERAEVVFHGCH